MTKERDIRNGINIQINQTLTREITVNNPKSRFLPEWSLLLTVAQEFLLTSCQIIEVCNDKLFC